MEGRVNDEYMRNHDYHFDLITILDEDDDGGGKILCLQTGRCVLDKCRQLQDPRGGF